MSRSSKKGPAVDAKLLKKIERLNKKCDVVRLGFVPWEDMPQLYTSLSLQSPALLSGSKGI